jgi:imidazoleglycerol phosphate synthase glutamine amidotransferase subunit HisH
VSTKVILPHIEQADKLILPGIGAFDTGMQHLRDTGLIGLLNEKVLKAKTPTLGVCLGIQLTPDVNSGHETFSHAATCVA